MELKQLKLQDMRYYPGVLIVPYGIETIGKIITTYEERMF